jgi:two-component system, OmpR family, response regulator
VASTVRFETEATRCLSSLEAFNPDVILLDIAMPRVSGYELARQIRARSQFHTVAIVSMSGYADQQHEQWALEAGCNRHVDLAAIEAVIADVVRSQLPAQN